MYSSYSRYPVWIHRPEECSDIKIWRTKFVSWGHIAIQCSGLQKNDCKKTTFRYTLGVLNFVYESRYTYFSSFTDSTDTSPGSWWWAQCRYNQHTSGTGWASWSCKNTPYSNYSHFSCLCWYLYCFIFSINTNFTSYLWVFILKSKNTSFSLWGFSAFF